jgi:bifunctional non-homologous end joining protein LigD
MKKGHLDFSLDGEKLKGRFHLVRMRKRPGERQEPWLLIKSEDEFSARKGDRDILEARPNSVVTGRSIEDIAGAIDRVWHSNRAPDDQPQARAPRRKAAPAKAARPRAKASKTRRAAAEKKPIKKKARKRARQADWSDMTGVRRRAMPDFVEPSLATLSNAAPSGDDWVHEIKFDGYRMQARLDNGRVTLKTRTGLDWTGRFPGIAEALGEIPVARAILDGEIVSQNERGVSDFSALQADLKAGRADRMVYYVFDLLYRDGIDLTGATLADRKKALTDLFGSVPDGPIRLSEAFDVPGPVLLEQAHRLHLEGIVSKWARAPYRAGRTGDWLKIKCAANQEFVIAGYEPSTTATRAIRALVLGYFDKGGLRYAGRVGTGFTVATERDLLKKLDAVKSGAMPFKTLPEEERRRKVKWVKPVLVAEIDFRGWTHGEVLRQASFKGLREDKAARDVVREIPKVAAAAQKIARKTSKAVPRKLTAQKKKDPIEVAGVPLSHPDRVYWSDAGVTKEMLAHYYEQVWEWMAPHLVDRPIALVRCPDGAEGQCFFQKHVSAGLEGERLISVPLKGEEPAIAVGDLPGLIALAQAGVLEIHTWGTHRQHIETCDFIVFDLDPGPGITLKQLIEGAREVRERLAGLKLKSFVKVTGGKGLHVVAPIAPAGWDAAKDFAHGIADAMEADNPQRYVATMAKSKRNNRIFVDYLRNGRGATPNAPY